MACVGAHNNIRKLTWTWIENEWRRSRVFTPSRLPVVCSSVRSLIVKVPTVTPNPGWNVASQNAVFARRLVPLGATRRSSVGQTIPAIWWCETDIQPRKPAYDERQRRPPRGRRLLVPFVSCTRIRIPRALQHDSTPGKSSTNCFDRPVDCTCYHTPPAHSQSPRRRLCVLVRSGLSSQREIHGQPPPTVVLAEVHRSENGG